MNQGSNPVYIAARILMAAIFVMAGVRKAMTYAGTVTYFGSLGLPFPEVVAALAAAFEIGAGLALVFGFQTRLVAIALAVFTLASAFIAHRFWSVDAAQYNAQFNNFFKNVAMVGGFMVIALFESRRIDTSRV